MSSTHPIRVCLGCAGEDDHPRHVFATPDGASFGYHMDCCAIARDCKVCKAQLEGVGGIKQNPKGDALRKHLLTTSPEADKPGWTAPVDEPAALAKKSREG